MHSWQGGGVISTTMTTAPTTKKTRRDDNGNNDHKYDDNENARTKSTSFLDITTNLWLDAFLEVRGGLLQAYAHEWKLARHDGSNSNN